MIGDAVELGPIYRAGSPTARDYRDALEDLAAAAGQLEPDGRSCAVCHDSGHQAWECHHNPLVMARRAVGSARAWRCYHCDVTVTSYDAADEHFGAAGDEAPACVLERVRVLAERLRQLLLEVARAEVGPLGDEAWTADCHARTAFLLWSKAAARGAAPTELEELAGEVAARRARARAKYEEAGEARERHAARYAEALAPSRAARRAP